MNRQKIAGQYELAIGKVQAKLASLIGHAELERAALQRQTRGRIMHAVGEAQDLIKRSLRHQRMTMKAPSKAV